MYINKANKRRKIQYFITFYKNFSQYWRERVLTYIIFYSYKNNVISTSKRFVKVVMCTEILINIFVMMYPSNLSKTQGKDIAKKYYLIITILCITDYRANTKK